MRQPIDDAFPTIESTESGHTTTRESGLTVREWYAGMVMQGIVSHGRVGRELQELYGNDPTQVAFKIADAMIAESNK